MGRRIVTAEDVHVFKSLGAGASRQKPDDYQTRVVKYIPVEIVAAFIALLPIFTVMIPVINGK